MNYQTLCIGKDAVLENALRQLDHTGMQILFVVNESEGLLGTLTDGDVRRYLLSGGTLADSVQKACYPQPTTAKSRRDAKKLLLKGANFAAIPVVDKAGRLVDVVFRDEEPKTRVVSTLNVPVVIMAGGKGTRLYPYTQILPKPLIPVGELPIIEHIMGQFAQYGCHDFHVIVNHKKQLIKAYFSENERQYQLCWYDEEKPLGTGGGLSLLRGKLQSTFFLTNCDILLLSDYEDMLRYHKTHGNAITMVAARKNVVIPYGVVETGEDGTIDAFREKPSFDFLTNTGMYIVEPEVLDDIEEDVPIGFPTIMEQQKAKGKKIGAYTVAEDQWLDMGQLEELEQMRKRLYGE